MLVLVGERANGTEVDGDQNFATRLKLGAFLNGRSRGALSSTELRWDEAFNLLPAIPTRLAQWEIEDRMLARKIAKQALEHYQLSTQLDPCTLVLCGARVAWAFDVPNVTFTKKIVNGVMLALIPHPSPRNRLWNSEYVNEEMTKFVRTL